MSDPNISSEDLKRIEEHTKMLRDSPVNKAMLEIARKEKEDKKSS